MAWADPAHRLMSFPTESEWRELCCMDISDLVNAGYYYIGPADRVQCWSCLGKVYNWVPTDTAWGEHTRLHPHCPLVKERLIGKRCHMCFLETEMARALTQIGFKQQQILSSFDACGPEATMDEYVGAIHTREGEACSRPPCPSRPVGKHPETLEALVQENEQLKESLECRVCFSNAANTLLLPCSHLVCCMSCVDKMKHCPVCRNRILGNIRVYRS
jgi:hypothetical protein